MKKVLLSFFGVRLCLPVPLEFFQGGENDILLQVQVPHDAMQIDVHKTLYPFCAIKKMPNVSATVANSVPFKKIYTEHEYLNS